MNTDSPDGWTYVLLSHPEMEPMTLLDQIEPREFLHLSLSEGKEAERVDDEPEERVFKYKVPFTMVGKDENRLLAFYIYGSWDFGDVKTFFLRNTPKDPDTEYAGSSASTTEKRERTGDA